MNCSLSNRQMKNKIFYLQPQLYGWRYFYVALHFLWSHLSFLLSFHFSARKNPSKKKHWENHSRQNSHFQIVAKNARHSAYYSGTTGAAKVSSKSKEGKHGSSSFWNSCRRLTEASRPHNPNRKTAYRTGSKT